MTCSATRGPAVVSAFHDNIDLVVGSGSGFGCDEPAVRGIKVEPKGVAYTPSIYEVAEEIVSGDRTVRIHAKHLTVCRGNVLSALVIVEQIGRASCRERV